MYLYTYYISYFILSLVVFFGRSKTNVFIGIFLLQAVNLFFIKYDAIDDFQNYKLMFENPTLPLDIGWKLISGIIGSTFTNFDLAIILIIILNLAIGSSLVFSINLKCPLQKSILIFLLIKWSLYEFITLRFGLASILCLSGLFKSRPNFFNKYLLIFVTALIHYSIFLFGVKFIWKRKTLLLICLSFVVLLFPLLNQIDQRILHYLDVEGLEFSYSVLIIMSFFIILFLAALYFERNKEAKQFAFLLIAFAVAIIAFQRFDTFNRVFFGLFVLAGFHWAKTSESINAKHILTFCFLLFSQIVLLRYTFFASDVNELIYK